MSRSLEPVWRAQAILRLEGRLWSASARSSSWRMKRWYGTPVSAAASLTAASRFSGRRMLSRADLGANSNRTGRIVLRSYRDRSARPTNDAAARSVLTTGNFRLVVSDFFGMHVPRADRSDPPLAVAHPQRKGHEHKPCRRGAPDAEQAGFLIRMGNVWKDPDLAVKNTLYLIDRHAVPGALGPIALVPVESADTLDHCSSVAVCMYTCLHHACS